MKFKIEKKDKKTEFYFESTWREWAVVLTCLAIWALFRFDII